MEYIFFCSHKKGQYPELSNWYPVEYTQTNGVKYKSSEQELMHRKALIFGDRKTAEEIMNTEDCEKIKALGRGIENFSQEEWDKVKEQIMYEALKAKFSSSEDLKRTLLSTGNKKLVETAPYDRVWGIGYNEEMALENINNWGQNLLGKILVKVRLEFQLSNIPIHIAV